MLLGGYDESSQLRRISPRRRMPLARGGICRAKTSTRGLPALNGSIVDQQVRPVCPYGEFLTALLLAVSFLSGDA